MLKLDIHKATLEGRYTLITTSNDLERDAVNAMIKQRQKINITHENQGCYLGLIGEEIILHIGGSSGVTAADSVGRCITTFIGDSAYPKPKLILLVGFCWGNPRFVVPGDIIIANSLYTLNKSTLNTTGETFKVKIIESPIEQDFLVQTCKNGPLGSLERLIGSTEYRDTLLASYPLLYGGEMEGFGFIPALKNRDISWLILKAVSDLGDDGLNRELQQKAAWRAASQIELLLKELKHLETESAQPAEIEHFRNVLRGEVILIDHSEFTLENLTHYLQYTIGPIVKSKLSEYFYAHEDSDKVFISSFCDVILEIAQNSFRHANSTQFKMSFKSKSFILQDDGKDYDLSTISGEQGGAFAWKRINKLFLSKGLVRYEHVKANTHKFHLQEVETLLRNIREKCSITVSYQVPSGGKGYRETLKYDHSCTNVYFNAKHMMMSSTMLIAIDQLKKMLEKGLTVYIEVEHDYQKDEYNERLIKYCDQVIIFRD